MDHTLSHWDGHSDLWVFGYGSLIWRPEFDHVESRLGRIHGYHRALCLWSRVNRGTPEAPGLVFGLDMGGSCQGRAYRIAAGQVPPIMDALWWREMPTGAYIPRWLSCQTPQGPLQALVFTMNRADDGYVPGLSVDQIVPIVRQGHGRYGPCTEYVLQTARALEAAGIHDRKLRAIARAVAAGHPSTEHPR
ncbi:gamma-glutamylcyclotransferase [Castellaniella sp. GW247-6E4]|uniref:gamma-glutamylcyclotransferase n=1 Tax=Castellaniella sp. GW247-6E4 TaxID=3140380 RepID=UPI003314AD8C